MPAFNLKILKIEDKKIEACLSQWRDWPFGVKPTLIKHFNQGLNNATALLSLGGRNTQFTNNSIPQTCVLKCFANKERAKKESHIHDWASQLGIAPKLYFISPDNEYVLMQTLSKPFDQKPSLNNVDIAAIAKSLKKVHNTELEQSLIIKPTDIGQIIAGYVARLDPNEEKHSELLAIHQKLKPALDAFAQDQTPHVLCHNDLVSENMFNQQQTVQFIDWEYAGTNNPLFDLASVVIYNQLNKDQAKALLRHYQTGLDHLHGTKSFYAAQISVLWLDVIWRYTELVGDEEHTISKQRLLNRVFLEYETI